MASDEHLRALLDQFGIMGPLTKRNLQTYLTAAGLDICTAAEREVLTELDAMFNRSPQWFREYLPTLHDLLHERERKHVAEVMSRRAAEKESNGG